MRVDGSAVDDRDWVSLSAIADARQVTRQNISKRVKRFVAAGKLTVKGEGRSMRVHLPSFEALVDAHHDPAQDLRNRHLRAGPPAPKADSQHAAAPEETPPEAAKQQPQPSAYDDASTREKHAKAALAEMQLAQKRGELIPVREIEAAAIEAGTKIAQVVSSLKAKAGKLYAAGATGGEEALHIVLVEAVNETLAQIGDSMGALAAKESD